MYESMGECLRPTPTVQSSHPEIVAYAEQRAKRTLSEGSRDADFEAELEEEAKSCAANGSQRPPG